MINFGSLWIEVFTIERKPLDKARITTDKGAVAREDGPGRYIIEQLILGSVTLQVEADGLQAEKREIRIELGRNVAQFILGEPGLPAYKRRGIRVPFRPVEGLVGISVRGKEAAKQLEKRIGKLADLKPIATRDLFVIQVTPGRLAKLVAELRGLPDIAAVGPVMHLSERGIAFFSGNIMVRVVPGTKPEAVETLAQETNTRVLRKLSLKDRWLLQSAVGDLSVLNDCDKLETSPIVLGAEAELTFTFEPDAITPTDELVAQQWHIPLVGLPDAWQHLRDANADGVVPGTANDRTFGDANLTIAVIDEGLTSETVGGVLRPAHPDFQGNVSNGQPKVTGFFDFGGMVANNNSPLGAHGTRCSGVATAMAGNASSVAGEEEGVSGAAPNARLLSVQVPSASTEAEFSDIYLWMAGLDPASTTPGFPAVLAQGAAVITNSAGTYNPAAFPVSDLIDATFERITDDGRGGLGTLLFFSAGNDNVQFASARPWANHPRTFGIAASNENDRKAGYSNFGDGIDLCAPSSDAGAGLRSITTTTLPGTGNRTGHTGGPSDYTNGFGGTSSTTPFAAGIATLMLSMDPSLTWQEIREILYNTAVKIDFANTDTEGRWRDRDGDGVNEYSNWYGYGRIDAAKAVCAARTRITLNTPTVQFLNVPAGEPTLRAISFSVQSTRNHTFRVIDGPITTIGPANSFVLHNGNEAIHVGNYTCSPSTPRIWVRYVATNVDDIAHGEAIVECVETGQQYTIQFSANVVERPRAALVLALDRSGSMDEFAGDGRRKIQVLRDSAVVVAALAQTDTGLGAVSWDSNADVAGAMPVQDAGFAGIGVGRNALSTHISAHNTNLAGMTAIGDGVLAAQNMLNAAPNAPGGYSVKAVVVLTDGREPLPVGVAGGNNQRQCVCYWAGYAREHPAYGSGPAHGRQQWVYSDDG
ncbi:S8 family serine peptidase [Fibrella forsythiae]|uniref:S8 family serine peptidase n=1 Tax=Fibrella forsythiae TaxID=2817061 RepID=A0ABS3JJW9_9BACT|nr:S8 family serine peptidase [Fibrella forsythiae]MBO0950285.1 S8 family serine peptidase [Fibrella forsythiae]